MTRGERIKKRREEMGMTQEDLAKKLGYKGKSGISRVESAGNDVSFKTCEKFAPVLETTPAELYGVASTGRLEVIYDFRKQQADPVRVVVEYMRKMDSETQKHLMAYAKFLTERKENDD